MIMSKSFCFSDLSFRDKSNDSKIKIDSINFHSDVQSTIVLESILFPIKKKKVTKNIISSKSNSEG